ncbi:MAG: hypothetical protein NTV62_03415 [Candidatus Gribaldobacteria bacterium]|nr:hypothetical protein [Candidatus Gribaldobacteria bacterium]
MDLSVIIPVANLILDLVLLVFMLSLLIPVLRGAPFVPTNDQRIKKAFELVDLKPQQRMVDIGSGDGRILLEGAKRGATAYGLEINPLLVTKTKKLAKKEGLNERVFCLWGNFWWHDFFTYDVVFIYGITYIMRGLEKKLLRELKPGAKVVAFVFPFPNWQPRESEGGIYIYEKSLS